MHQIRIIQAFKNSGKEFQFPEDLHLFLEKEIEVYVAVEHAPDCYEMIAVDAKILENTIISNNKNNFNTGFKYDDPGSYDPWDWAVIKAKVEDIWMNKSDVNALLDAGNKGALSKTASRFENQTIQILSAAIQTLTNELILLKSESKFIKKVKDEHSLNVEILAREIEDHSHRWWTGGVDGKMPMGMGSRNIKDKINAALKFSTSAE